LLAGIQAQDQQWKELAETTDKLIRVNPVDVPAAYFYKTVAHYNLADLDEAEKAARQGIQIDTQHRVPRLHHLLGNILADDRNFAEAIEQMKLYVKYAPDAKDRDEALKLAEQWTSLALEGPAGDKP
jgi:tetratricopeptide (TPR) repeat protein